jgi:(p)ppGpp synthase/HD superfamily hydrolase
MIVEKAKKYAEQCHNSTNQMYDNKPYTFHLQMVVDVANQFIHLIPENLRADVIAGCWVHDCIEDCRQTYNDVVKATNQMVAEYAYALTNEKGKTREERANDKYYEGIRNLPYATFIKLCDRIANVLYSKQNQSEMFDKYVEEYSLFEKKLYEPQYSEMFDYIRNVIISKE